MDRRDFFKLLGATGVTIPYWSYIPQAHAQAAGLYTGKVLINVLCEGGMDQSSWTDPRMNPQINNYAQPGRNATIGAAGNIRFAPLPAPSNIAAFFTRFAPMTLVINGINSETNDHDAGRQANATGQLAMGFPTTNELHANRYGKSLPMGWVNGGGFSRSAGLVPPTPVPNAQTFRALLTPNQVDATNDRMKQGDMDKWLAARAARAAAFKADPTTLPRMNIVSDQFLAASESRALLASVAQFIPAQFNQNFANAHVAMVAAQAGITSTISIQAGGFDTHGDNENRFIQASNRLMDMISFIWDTAAQMNIANRIVVRTYTDFGRVGLNNDNGKDHLGSGCTSIIMEQNAPWANRVVGATGPTHQGLRINAQTGAVDPNGVRIAPRHVHDSLRRYLGIETTDPRFNLAVPAAERIDFFNPAVSTGYPNL